MKKCYICDVEIEPPSEFCEACYANIPDDYFEDEKDCWVE